MQDLKTGHLHGASPRAQFYGQMIGSLASVFVSSGIYLLYRNVYEFPNTSFPVPTAAIWFVQIFDSFELFTLVETKILIFFTSTGSISLD